MGIWENGTRLKNQRLSQVWGIPCESWRNPDLVIVGALRKALYEEVDGKAYPAGRFSYVRVDRALQSGSILTDRQSTPIDQELNRLGQEKLLNNYRIVISIAEPRAAHRIDRLLKESFNSANATTERFAETVHEMMTDLVALYDRYGPLTWTGGVVGLFPKQDF